MTNEKIVSAAIEQLEKEKQEAEISKIKGIVKAYLEKILNKKEKIREMNKELKELESDLDDLKAGRLDKIEERQNVSPEHNNLTLIYVKRIEKEYIPYQPWRSPWIVEWRSTISPSNGIMYYDSSALPGQYTGMTTTGNQFQNFSCGTYTINGQNYNL